MKPPPVPTQFAALIGLDWADQKHDYCLRAAGADQVQAGQFDHSPQSIAAWVAQLRQRFGPGKIAICLEQSRGALIYALAQYDNLVLFPINPQTLAKFRQAFYPSGAKNDPCDAQLLLDVLCAHRDKLRAWQPDDAQTRQLTQLVEGRRDLVGLCTQLTNRQKATLKSYFPQALELVGEDLSSPMATDFLQKWPTLEEVKKAKPAALRKFYYGHNSRSPELIQERLALISKAVALTSDEAIIEPAALRVRTLALQLAQLKISLAEYERRIAKLFAAHPEAPLFDSLPGAGPALAPRLLVAFGTDRERYPQPDSMQRYSGIAPVTQKSGKNQHWVHIRWACPKFVRQSFHEYAAQSIRFCAWAKLCYEEFRRRGKGHQAALRALAFKWIRIIWRCWQNRAPYDEATYLRGLQNRGIKIYAELWDKPAATHGE